MFLQILHMHAHISGFSDTRQMALNIETFSIFLVLGVEIGPVSFYMLQQTEINNHTPSSQSQTVNLTTLEHTDIVL